ncbi:hypothetical protein AAD018_009120 [Aestuariibius insulae]|uniref:hypothetical protein n=1 Tax=Aestuariibius insulae TaxID=2058287 RepID=UPI00345E0E77
MEETEKQRKRRFRGDPYAHFARYLDREAARDKEPEERDEERSYQLSLVSLIVGEVFENLRDARGWLLEELLSDDPESLRAEESEITLLSNRLESGEFRPDQAFQDQKEAQEVPLAEAYSVYVPWFSEEEQFEPIEARYDGRLLVEIVGPRVVLDPMEALTGFPQPLQDPTDAPTIAIIDDGIGFLNQRFCRDGDPMTTRFEGVWLQALKPIFIPNFGPVYVMAGAALSPVDINAVLARGPELEEDHVYRQINRALVSPGEHPSTEFPFTHGTFVGDLAGGAEPGAEDPVEEWPLLGVSLPPLAVSNTAGTQLEPSIVMAVHWCLGRAEALGGNGPLVINVSFGTMAGPRDGSKLLERIIAWDLAEWEARTKRCARIVFSFGNNRVDRLVGRIAPSEEKGIMADWRALPDDFAASYLEVRADDPSDVARLAVSLGAPDTGGLDAAGLPPGFYIALSRNGKDYARIYHVGARTAFGGGQQPPYYLLALAPTMTWSVIEPAPAGAWPVEVGITSGGPVEARLEIQRGDTPTGYRLKGRQSYLDHPDAHLWDPKVQDWSGLGPDAVITQEGTHSSFCTIELNSHQALTVGAAVPDPEVGPAYRTPGLEAAPRRYSAEGAPWSVPGPTLAALGDDGRGLVGLVASGTISGSTQTMNGTSAAAGQVSRALAHVLIKDGCKPIPVQVENMINWFGVPSQPGMERQAGAGLLSAQLGSRKR